MITRIEDIADWLLEAGTGRASLLDLTREVVQKIHEVGGPLSRINLGVFALHPEMAGYVVHWESGMDAPVETPIRREDTRLPVYLESPIRWMVENQSPVRFNLEDPEQGREFPVLDEFRRAGTTDYRGFPLGYGADGVAVLTVCTDRPGGFEAWEVSGIAKLFPVLRLLIEVVETRRLAQTVLHTYLGGNTGDLVLEGKILRGQGETIQAGLWLCDLRGFTSMTEDIGADAIIEVMNLYFDCMAEAVWSEGGEILKFMGDALLAVFRITEQVSPSAAAQRGARAAVDAQRRLAALSRRRAAEDLGPLHAGIAVHLGEVVYGNIGARTRLDFTVMGNSVNLLARLQSLTGQLEEPILLSSSVARHVTDPIESVGKHSFKGVERPVEVFRLLESEAEPAGWVWRPATEQS